MHKIQKLWPTLKRLIGYGLSYRKPLGIALLMLWIASVAEVIGPILMSYFIDNCVSKRQLPIAIISSMALIYVLLALLEAVLHYFQTLLFNQTAVGIVQRLRTDVMDAALRQPISAFDSQPVGQLISRITNDTEVIKDLYVMVLATVLKSMALIVTMLVAMFILNWHMALVAVCIFPAVLIVMGVYQYYSAPIMRQVRSDLATINNGFNEVINGMSVIQQFRQQIRFGKRLCEASKKHYTARMKNLRLDAFLLRPLLSLFSTLVLCGLLMLFGYSNASITSVGVLYAFINYLGRLNEPLIELTSQQSVFQQALVAGERVFELMDCRQQSYGADDYPLTSGSIDIKDLSFSYNADKKVLQHISLSVSSCSCVALVGHTGSGKSTLANLLMGHYLIDEGEVRLDGRLLSTLTRRALRLGMAMVQQEPTIIADSVLINITLGRDIDEKIVWSALRKAQLANFVCGLPQGIHTRLGELGNNLSVGQKQLLSMARVLVQEPRILILDEATANIDSGTEQAIQNALRLIRERTTLIVIAHRLSTIVDADLILVLHHGYVVEQGNHEQLLKKQGRYYKMHQLQQAGEAIDASRDNIRLV